MSAHPHAHPAPPHHPTPLQPSAGSGQTTQTSRAAADADSPSAQHSGWALAPYRHKTALLILASIAAGALVASLEDALGNPIWVLLIGLAAAAAILVPAAITCLAEPLERLYDSARRAHAASRPMRTDETLTERADELGQLARLTRRLSIAAFQCQVDNKRLRRTMDHAVTSATRRATEQLRKLTLKDPLTDLANRRFLDSHLPGLVEASQKSGTELPCLLIDLDNFKRVNDTQGHETGDKLLRFLADLLRSQIRPDDYAIRLGGDEFALLLPGANFSRVEQLTARLTELFDQRCRVEQGAMRDCGLSFGAAYLLADKAHDAEALMRLADSRLYAHKRARKATPAEAPFQRTAATPGSPPAFLAAQASNRSGFRKK